ncbi:hypothetical protein [Polyangium sp. 6x1]|uniref:hypothetical protein n=1 Tax=Polyangium sp. 6x1 TaxID=3042689 RepID=UPI00248232E3|nr:hypothetical protein [Polyangium sp. 6x1]MDI1447931.1 hypothetical protein [Polyangium sp. 6x1]
MASESERLPTTLRITNGAMAMDGGSLTLHAVDQDGARVELFLDWSIRSHQEGKTQFYANGQPVPRGAPEEARWLSLIGGSVPKPHTTRPTSEESGRSSKGVILAEDAAGYFNAIEQGPASALAHLASRLVSLVSSQAYQKARAPVSPQAPQDRARSSLAAAMKEAMRHCKVVTRIPIEELWTDDGALPATRLRALDRAAIRDLLRLGSVRFVVANVGQPLQWIPPTQQFDFWRRDGNLRLAKADEIRLGNFPDGMAYRASEWTVPGDEAPIILLEVYH